MTRKAFAAADLAATIYVAGIGIAAAQEVKVGVAAEPYPPFTTPDASGAWGGREIDIMHAICAAEALDCVVTPVAWDGIIPSLTGKQTDVILGPMSITEERSNTIDFSRAHYKMPAVIVAEKGSGIEPTPEGLAGRILAVQAPTTHQAYANAHFGASDIRVCQTRDEANQDLVAGRVDAIEADSLAMADFVASDIGACREIAGDVAPDDAILGQGVGSGLRKGDTELMSEFNDGIDEILADGTYVEITCRHFTTSITLN